MPGSRPACDKPCGFLPPYIVEHLFENADPDVRRVAFRTIEATTEGRTRRETAAAAVLGRSSTPGIVGRRTVCDMEGRFSPLPGTPKRQEGQPDTGQPEVDEAYDNAGKTRGFYHSVLQRASLDGMGHALVASVNYGNQVANAFWDGERMIYGAGDGDLFLSFTKSLAIAAHEMTHGVLNFSSQLEYQGEPGALNESFCDAIGISVDHYAAGADVAAGSWFMGGEVVGPGLGSLRGFRSFSDEPAYRDHPILGTDPQPKHMRDFIDTDIDHGGVHLNSGIPNRAFYLAAQSIGGYVWDTTTKIWHEAFTSVLNKRATFAQAADATSTVAQRRFGDREAQAVIDAWRTVGVDREGRT